MNTVVKKLSSQDLQKMFVQLQSKKWPRFGAGDTITISERIFEEKKSRIQKFQGVVLKRLGKGPAENVLVRKESANGVHVEKFFPINSPLIEEIKIERLGKVRRAYLTYQRKRFGKAARIKERKFTA